MKTKLYRPANYQDFLKLLALGAMIIDHLGLYFFPQITFMRIIGRCAMPIFCFFAGYNYKNHPKIKLLIYGVLLHCFLKFCIASNSSVANILIAIFLGQTYIWLQHKILARSRLPSWLTYCQIILLVAAWNITRRYIDYGTVGTAIMLAGHHAQNYPRKKDFMAAVTAYISLLHSLINFGTLMPVEIMAVGVVSGTLYLLLITVDFKRRVDWRINYLTSYLSELYVLHWIMIESYYHYCWRP